MKSPPCGPSVPSGRSGRRSAPTGRPRPGGPPAHRPLHDPHLGVGLGVGLTERAHRCACRAGAARWHRHSPDPRPRGRTWSTGGLGVEEALLGEAPGDAAHERLGHRHQQVRCGRGHASRSSAPHQLARRGGRGRRRSRCRRRRPRRWRRTRPTGSSGSRSPTCRGPSVSGRGAGLAGISWVGMISRMCWKAHRTLGGSCQVPRVTRESAAGGNPAMRSGTSVRAGVTGCSELCMRSRYLSAMTTIQPC